MRISIPAAAAILLLAAAPALAHAVDEYVQATTIAVEKDRVRAEIRLTPGVAVFPNVRAAIDADRDGAFSAAEQRAYVERVRQDLSLAVDGDRLRLRLVSSTFAPADQMREGLGAIQLAFDAELPPGGPNRRLVFENHHLPRIAVYLVNGLVPRDSGIRVGAQRRDYAQSRYELDYVQAGTGPGPLVPAWWARRAGWLSLALLSIGAWLALLRQPVSAATRPLPFSGMQRARRAGQAVLRRVRRPTSQPW